MKKFRNKIKDKLSQDGNVSDSLGQWMAIGMCFGIVIGVITENVGLWLSVGLCIGVAIGSTIEEKKNKEWSEHKSKGKEPFSSTKNQTNYIQG